MDFNEHVRRQFPLRPDHPDFERLREVVQMVEDLKAARVSAEKSYEGVIDVLSASYMAANRMGMNLPAWIHQLPKEAATEVLDLMTNAWVEGLFFGVEFERRGGHRVGESDATNP